MSFKYYVASLIYSINQISLGLLLHPYQTMQSLVRDKVFVWMSLLPTLFLAFVTVGWKWVIVPVVRLFFSCQTSGLSLCEALPIISNWLTFFCVYWQILLIYLLFRFSWVFKIETTTYDLKS